MDSDLISRQASIDAFDGAKVDEEYCDEYEIGYNDGINFAISKLSVLPSAQRKGKWIPVTERLPEPVAESQKREWFITSNQYGGVTITCYEFESSPFKEGWQTDMTILAWMPLPAPWEGGES